MSLKAYVFMGLCVRGPMSLWAYVFVGLCVRRPMCLWAYVSVVLCVRVPMCSWAYVFVGVSAQIVPMRVRSLPCKTLTIVMWTQWTFLKQLHSKDCCTWSV